MTANHAVLSNAMTCQAELIFSSCSVTCIGGPEQPLSGVSAALSVLSREATAAQL